MLLGATMAGTLGFFNAVIKLGDRLWKKPATAEQHIACSAQHSLLKASLDGHLDALKEMSVTMQKFQQAISELVKNDELRHELMLAELRNLNKSQELIMAELRRIRP